MQYKAKYSDKFKFTHFLMAGIFMILCLHAEATLAAAETIGALASGITASFGGIVKLITGGSYLAGIGFALGAILKFKAHKDNPTQIPIGTPIALIFVAAALMFLPTVYTSSGATIFSSGTKGTLSGISNFS